MIEREFISVDERKVFSLRDGLFDGGEEGEEEEEDEGKEWQARRKMCRLGKRRSSTFSLM